MSDVKHQKWDVRRRGGCLPLWRGWFSPVRWGATASRGVGTRRSGSGASSRVVRGRTPRGTRWTGRSGWRGRGLLCRPRPPPRPPARRRRPPRTPPTGRASARRRGTRSTVATLSTATRSSRSVVGSVPEMIHIQYNNQNYKHRGFSIIMRKLCHHWLCTFCSRIIAKLKKKKKNIK